MKRIIRLLLAALVIAAMLVPCAGFEVLAASGSVSASAGSIYAGATVQVYVNLSGSSGAEFSLSYDSSVLTLTGSSALLSGWQLEGEGYYVLYDNNASNPISGSASAAMFTFTANSNAAGKSTSVSVSGVVSNVDGSGSASFSSSTTINVLALSDDCTLSSLSIDGISLSPAFSAATLNYTANADVDCESITVSASQNEPNASVSGTGSYTLNAGPNVIPITVTAQNGTQKTYQIIITKAAPTPTPEPTPTPTPEPTPTPRPTATPQVTATPDATATPEVEETATPEVEETSTPEVTVEPTVLLSTVNKLAAIEPECGELSPEFNADTTEYVIWLPYEYVGKSFKLTAVPADERASVRMNLLGKLEAGENVVELSCVSESGDERKYTVTVYVMPAYAGSLEFIGGSTLTPTPTPSVEPDDDLLLRKGGISPGLMIALFIAWAIIGCICGVLWSSGIANFVERASAGIGKAASAARSGLRGFADNGLRRKKSNGIINEPFAGEPIVLESGDDGYIAEEYLPENPDPVEIDSIEPPLAEEAYEEPEPDDLGQVPESEEPEDSFESEQLDDAASELDEVFIEPQEEDEEEFIAEAPVSDEYEEPEEELTEAEEPPEEEILDAAEDDSLAVDDDSDDNEETYDDYYDSEDDCLIDNPQEELPDEEIISESFEEAEYVPVAVSEEVSAFPEESFSEDENPEAVPEAEDVPEESFTDVEEPENFQDVASDEDPLFNEEDAGEVFDEESYYAPEKIAEDSPYSEKTTEGGKFFGYKLFVRKKYFEFNDDDDE